jgi:hypothetical protein
MMERTVSVVVLLTSGNSSEPVSLASIRLKHAPGFFSAQSSNFPSRSARWRRNLLPDSVVG